MAARASARSLCGRWIWNGGNTEAEAVAVTGEPTEGGDVMVTTIMATWNVWDPMGVETGTVVDMRMMGNDAQR